ncbi:ring finger and WD repeat domain-containing protein 3 [Trichonephila clavata]|uniref:Ring finger and WD repeat domain-containing protein 3 n=1 Tax=Trichonephila clavata TaxID=2740835 RepID=A0A8X6HAN6_TRICU|nr:ring finger and WD repeat domain-containing protein 3 [Trichonephila clavata]
MDEGSGCPICFGEFTTSSDHKIVSMKCGHLFGHSCLMSWFGSKKKAMCPICTIQSTKSQLRIIFASKVVALGSEKERELVDKYVTELSHKNSIIRENQELKAQIDCLKLELKQAQSKKEEFNNSQPVLHKQLFKRIRIDFESKNSCMIFDEVHHLLIISCKRNENPTLIKYGSLDFDVFSFKIYDDCTGFIKSLKLSPFGDGLIVFGLDKTLYLVNPYNFCTVFSFDLTEKVTSTSFNKDKRNYLFCGTERGYIYLFDLDDPYTFLNRYSASNVAIHSLHCEGEHISGASVYETFNIYTGLNVEGLICNRTCEAGYICTNMYGYDHKYMFTFRAKDRSVIHYICEEPNDWG